MALVYTCYTLSVCVHNNPRFGSSLRNITGESVGGSDKLRNSSLDSAYVTDKRAKVTDLVGKMI